VLIDRGDVDVVAAAYDSIAHQFMIIGEAVTKLPKEFTKRHPEIPWSRIRGTRHFIAHEYWGIDFEMLLDVAENQLTTIDGALAEALDNDLPVSAIDAEMLD
jgi:uncharacterized protein with HEPN domain